jgi:hypothetical protein
MSVMLECDRCGFQEQTASVMLLARLVGPGIPSLRPELPDGWTRPRLPNEDGSADDRELCPGCKADLFRFMAGGQVVDTPPGVCRGCGHAAHDKPCRELTMPGAPGDVDECGCNPKILSTEARPPQICPGCGHLRHNGLCSDQVPEVGPCGCGYSTPRNELRELGVDD